MSYYSACQLQRPCSFQADRAIVWGVYPLSWSIPGFASVSNRHLVVPPMETGISPALECLSKYFKDRQAFRDVPLSIIASPHPHTLEMGMLSQCDVSCASTNAKEFPTTSRYRAADSFVSHGSIHRLLPHVLDDTLP
ncbi:hypothetical protein AcW1_008287 [Taiwanofungus camphoratus]|nr:hypothetical protein AcW1_008287 [Antrodia cinnamomea]KAI0956061.1 hypothetical protein AcV7_006570 [Antrodia cinnamomea]